MNIFLIIFLVQQSFYFVSELRPPTYIHIYFLVFKMKPQCILLRKLVINIYRIKKMHVTVHQYCKKMAIYSYSEAIKTLVLYLYICE